MVGVSGSGKSTVAVPLSKEINAIIVSPDQIRLELTGDISDQSQNKVVWAIAKRRVKTLLYKNRNVILDATNLNDFYRQEFVSGLPPHILQAKVVSMRFDIAKKRIDTDIRNKKVRSKVPIQVLEYQFEDFKGIRKRLIKEGFELI